MKVEQDAQLLVPTLLAALVLYQRCCLCLNMMDSYRELLLLMTTMYARASMLRRSSYERSDIKSTSAAGSGECNYSQTLRGFTKFQLLDNDVSSEIRQVWPTLMR
jgi:hypothetical protein